MVETDHPEELLQVLDYCRLVIEISLTIFDISIKCRLLLKK